MHKRIRSPFDVPELRAMIFDWARVMTGHESQTIVFEKNHPRDGYCTGVAMFTDASFWFHVPNKGDQDGLELLAMYCPSKRRLLVGFEVNSYVLDARHAHVVDVPSRTNIRMHIFPFTGIVATRIYTCMDESLWVNRPPATRWNRPSLPWFDVYMAMWQSSETWLTVKDIQRIMGTAVWDFRKDLNVLKDAGLVCESGDLWSLRSRALRPPPWESAAVRKWR